MKLAEIVIAVLAFVTGMTAAWYWYRASKITADPGWGPNGLAEPGIHSAAQDAWIASMLRSSAESAHLNQVAAEWTAVTVALTAVATIVSVV